MSPDSENSHTSQMVRTIKYLSELKYRDTGDGSTVSVPSVHFLL